MELATFIRENSRYPVGRKGESSTKEGVLAKFVSHVREANRDPVNASIRLSEDRLLFIR